MKTIRVIPSLFVLASLSMTACAPRDVAVTSPEERAFIQSRKGRTPTVGAQGAQSKTGIIEKSDLRVDDKAVALVLLEKQAEVLEVIAASQLDRYQTKGAYSVEAKAKAASLERTLLVARNKETKVESAEALKTILNSEWNFDVYKETAGDTSKIVMIEGKNKETRISLDRAQKSDRNTPKLFANLNLSNAELRAYPIKDSAAFKVYYSAEGLLNAAKDKMSAWPVKLKIEMDVDLADLTAAELKISKVYSSIIVGEAKPREIRLFLPKEKSLTFKNDNCPQIVGSIQVETPIYKKGQGDRPEFQKIPVELGENEANFDSGKYTSPNKACGQRPTVDLSRLLN